MGLSVRPNPNLPAAETQPRIRTLAMTATFRTMTFAVALLLGLVAWQPANADHGHALGRIDNLSQAIQAESRELYYELRSISFSSPELRSAQSEVGQIYQLASRIHDGVHGA